MAKTEKEWDKIAENEHKRLFNEELDLATAKDPRNVNPISKLNAIRELYEGEYTKADGWGDITWKDGHKTTKEQKKKIDGRYVEMYLDYRDKKYQRDRAEVYPSPQEQLAYIGDHGLDAWQEDMIKPIKEKFPKNG